MIDKIVVGRGNKRTVVTMVRDREQRKSVAKAIIGHLFPTSSAYQQAKRVGEQRAKRFRNDKRMPARIDYGRKVAFA